MIAGDLRWQFERLENMRAHDAHDVLALRCAVFIVEQGCTFQDPDSADSHSWHLLGHDATGVLAAYLRIVDPGAKYPEPSIGRVATPHTHRGVGYGIALMREGIACAQRLWPAHDIRIAAQLRLWEFYRRFGFECAGEMYIEDGIEHIEMVRASTSRGGIAAVQGTG